jgi:adenylosuccinate lyase
MAGVVERLIVYPENMARNLALLGGLHNSQRVLLALTQAGVSREDAYKIVQRNAMDVWRAAPPRASDALLAKLSADADVSAKLKPEALAALFNDAHHFAQVDTIFKRVFG